MYKDEHTLILHISSFKRSKDLGSKHWCISTDKYQWDNYTSYFNKQYFIYDFSKDISDKKAKIGVTIKPNGSLEDAHLNDDTSVKWGELIEYHKYLKPYDKEFIRDKVDLSDYEILIQYGFIDEFKQLLNNGLDPSVDNNYAISMASEHGQLEIVKLLLSDPRVDPSDKDNYDIKMASYNGHLEIVKLLLQDKRVDPSAKDNYAIRFASDFGHLEIVKLLLDDEKVLNSLTEKDINKYKDETSKL